MKKKPRSKLSDRNELRRKLVSDIELGNFTLGQALVTARLILDKNQADYSKIVGVSKSIIAAIELNRGNPTIDTINKLFAPVGLSVGLRAARSRRQSEVG